MAQQEGLERYRLRENYYDIMLVGMTGQGKSTMADKLLIANPKGVKYEPPEDPNQQPQATSPDDVPDKVKVTLTDISSWLLHESDKEELDTHLKGLVYCRTTEEPHMKVNTMRDPKTGVFNLSTSDCQVFSNDTTNIRILDVPGFQDAKAFKSPPATPTSPSRSIETSNVHQAARNIADFHIGLTRNIIRIQAALGMCFRRIVYFIPVRGPLERANSLLKSELQSLDDAFGASIFKCMVAVATVSRRFSLKAMDDEEKFPEEDVVQSKEFFQVALAEVLGAKPGDTIPKVPIIFISLSESCESILDKVQSAPVTCERLKLEFNPSTCANCGLKIGSINDERVTCAFRENPDDTFPYDESTCHPAFKQSLIRRFFGKSISARVTKRWPSYKEEYCIVCENRPFEQGCMQVKKKHKTWWGKVYVVDHTSQVTEPVKEPETTPAETNPSDASPTAGSEGFTGPGRQADERRADQLVNGVGAVRLVMGEEGGVRQDVEVQASPPVEIERKGT